MKYVSYEFGLYIIVCLYSHMSHILLRQVYKLYQLFVGLSELDWLIQEVQSELSGSSQLLHCKVVGKSDSHIGKRFGWRCPET